MLLPESTLINKNNKGANTAMNIFKKRNSKLLPGLGIILMSTFANASDWPDSLVADMDEAAAAITNKWIDGRDPTGEAWAWGEGVLAYGLVKSAHAQNDTVALAWLGEYIDYHDEQGKEMEWSDDLSPAASSLYLSLNLDSNNEVKTIAEDVVNYIMTAPRSPNDNMLIHFGYKADEAIYSALGYPEAWVDSLFHITPTLLMYSELTGDDSYLEEAIVQVEAIVGGLQDPDTGLVAHAKFDNDSKDYQVPSWSSNEFWARGNGWALVSLVELVTEMPQDHQSYAGLLDRAQRLEKKLREEQGKDGRYHTLVTKSSSYYETAATGLILYAMAKGYEAGIFPDETQDAVIKGAEGLLDKTLTWTNSDTKAKVRYTSIGTNPDPGLYRFIARTPNKNYGVGAWLMLASEIID
jgi:rhamnogalacturonyl hydrolase YesR